MATIISALQAVKERIALAAKAAGRSADEIQLLAVSKSWPAEAICEAWMAGQRAFGESYVQEAIEKIARVEALLTAGSMPAAHARSTSSICEPCPDSLTAGIEPAVHARSTSSTREPCPDSLTAGIEPAVSNHSSGVASPSGALLRPPEWHFLGPIQSNKTRPIAEHFSWVHSVDRLKIAQRLNQARPENLPPLNVCIQVNISGESTKSGMPPAGVAALAREMQSLPRLRLRGLMAIPRPTPDTALQRRQFGMLRELLNELNAEGLRLDTLSMGMSDDLEAAIAEGATIVRVGSAIFGERKNP